MPTPSPGVKKPEYDPGLRILNVDSDEIARYVKTRILRQGGKSWT